MAYNQMTVEQRLDKAVVDIMSKPELVAIAGVMMIGKRSVSETMPTAATDGKNEFYGRAFVDSLNDAELRFLVLHEVYHKLYRHLITWQWMWHENPLLANKACDHVINLQIQDELGDSGWVKMPKGGCFDEKYRGWDAAQVYRDLVKEESENGGGGGSAGGEGFDEHLWEQAQEMGEEEQRELIREIDEALRQGVLAAGKVGSGGNRNFDELLESQVNWRDEMREFVQTTCSGSDYSTWKRPNRRYIGAGHYMPSGISEQLGEIIIAPDMSGSTFSPDMMRAIMSEVRGIAEALNPSAVRILYWDTKVCGDERYEGDDVKNLINTTKPEGGGGTAVSCVSDYIRSNQIKAQCVIVLTDGYLGGDWGSWDHPTLWVIADNRGTSSPVGKTLHVTARDM